ncbi:alpha-ribazole phosphatase/probable phosphoglycerate mutase [Tumebacillus sp. BK434]|uniref:histidine phosphatase family protein n=1 Tax=Tumebacillus sp. BK434 TaxID=2512169 RepID=UPI00104E4AA7|nr:histidine phosphatase family protein [Tumebacillus sp. BK434]TCP59629.1 alpha-ribazole phosphatase/probable phosphoglycerate mutase [Tumebacillus sp. BK434]
MNQPVQFTLVRHGETIWNREMRLQGSKDIPLSETGLAQAERVAARLSRETFHVLYTSRLLRAHKTGETIAAAVGVPHHVQDDLRERHFGEFEGCTRQEILDRYPDFWTTGFSHDAPGVESFEALSARAYRAINLIADQHPGEHVVLVSHGGTINAFLHAITDGRLGSGISKLGNTSITRVLRDADGSWQVLEIGCTAHLES